MHEFDFTIDAKDLRDYLQIFSKYMKTVSVPIMECIFLRCDEASSTVEIQGGDFDVGFSKHLSAAVFESYEGQWIGINCNKLLRFLNTSFGIGDNIRIFGDKLNTKIEIEPDDTTLFEGAIHLSLETVSDNIAYYTESHKSKEFKSFAFNCHSFINSLEDIKFAISKEETRYYLNGVYITRQKNGDGELVATNGHVLACINDVSISFDDDWDGVILPRDAVNAICKLQRFIADDEIGEAIVSNGRIYFEMGDFKIMARIIDGSFPDYEKIIISDFKSEAILNSSALLRATQICTSLVKNLRHAVMEFELGYVENKVLFSIKDCEKRTITFASNVEFTGEKTRIGFNPQFISNIAKRFPSQMKWQIRDAGSQIKITGDNFSGLSIILMPARV